MSTTAPKEISLEITSDSICPFCYVGKRRIEEAIRRSSHLPLKFNIRFSPFLLDPNLPSSPGENKRERYQRRFGGVDKVAAMEQAMIERGKQCDPPIAFSYDGVVSQTTDSHRIIEKAYQLKGEDGQLALVERLFKTYFEESGDPGSHDLLARDAVSTGIFASEADAKAFLASDELLAEVQAGIRKAQLRGISGVPFTIINDKYGISGAQETETFVEVFEKLAKGELEA
ncbi:thioredoxin-like protein [Rhodotorula diobovata]|uniref:Thioredoxin-like protein n=1 Tax=Rhodotorula diobovata TaxID=5288 RepID=A0A5C5FWR7_9BASI|nr:thioredoxin-like protein [Rhodotorula diobovata]